MTRGKKMIWALLIAVALPLAALALVSALAQRPDNLGAAGGKLRPCPDTPNCVHSQSDSPQHAMPPIQLTASPETAMRKLKSVVESFPRAKIVTETQNYLHAEFDSRIFRFTDDVEFLIDEEAGVIHFRSASRVGRSDLGVNRRRMQAIREAFTSPEAGR